MKKIMIAAVAALTLAACQTSGSTGAGATASSQPSASEADAIVAAIKAEQSDFRAYCRSGRDAIRQDVTNKVAEMVATGQIKGNPNDVGQTAGQKIAAACRG